MKKDNPPPRYSRAAQTGWDNSLILKEKPVSVTLTLEELDALVQAALAGQVSLRNDIESMQADPDVERHEVSHFRAILYRRKAMLDNIEQKMISAEVHRDKVQSEQGDFSAWEKFPGGF